MPDDGDKQDDEKTRRHAAAVAQLRRMFDRYGGFKDNVEDDE